MGMAIASGAKRQRVSPPVVSYVIKNGYAVTFPIVNVENEDDSLLDSLRYHVDGGLG